MDLKAGAIALLFVVDVAGLSSPEDIVGRFLLIARVLFACHKAALLTWRLQLVNLAVPYEAFEEALQSLAKTFPGL